MNWYSEWLERFSNTLSKQKKEWLDKKFKEAREQGYAQGRKDNDNRK